MEKGLEKNKQLERVILDGCDAFLFNILKALTKNTSIQELRLISESFVVLRIAHSQCLHL